jgi:hypothetical protein
LKAVLVTAAFFVGIIALKSYLESPARVRADSARFDHVQIVASAFLYNGNQGMLVLDKRNGNVWFLARMQDTKKTWFKDPTFLLRVPLEKLDEPPPQ